MCGRSCSCECVLAIVITVACSQYFYHTRYHYPSHSHGCVIGQSPIVQDNYGGRTGTCSIDAATVV